MREKRVKKKKNRRVRGFFVLGEDPGIRGGAKGEYRKRTKGRREEEGKGGEGVRK